MKPNDEDMPGTMEQSNTPSHWAKATRAVAKRGISDDEAPTAIAQGTFFSRYKILKVLGEGLTAHVYKAYDPQLDRMVALKVFSRQEKETHYQRFLREAKSTAQLNHANIVTVYDIGMVRGRPFFTMEFIEGTTLYHYLLENSLKIRQIVEIVKIIATAVHYAHTQGIVHRDIKPTNVMMDHSQIPYVADFGLAKLLHENNNISKTGTILGTPHYMPPEQAQGKIRQIDERSDVYSLGAVLYEMLTRRPPFTGATSVDIVYNVVHKKAIPPSRIKRRVPKGIERICLKALEKKKSARYQSAAEFVEDLERFAKGESVVARAPKSNIFSVIRQHKIFVTITLLCLFLLFVFSYVELWKKDLRREEWQRDLQTARNHYDKGDYDSALLLYQVLLQKSPTSTAPLQGIIDSAQKWVEGNEDVTVILQQLEAIAHNNSLPTTARAKIESALETIRQRQNTGAIPEHLRYDLRGIWQGYGYVYGVKPQKIYIEQNQDKVTATKITGDNFVPAGEVTWTGMRTDNPFAVQVRVAGQGFRNPGWTQGKVQIVDKDLLFVHHPKGTLVVARALRESSVHELSGLWDGYGYSSTKAEVKIVHNEQRIVASTNGEISWRGVADSTFFSGELYTLDSKTQRKKWVPVKICIVDKSLVLILLRVARGPLYKIVLVMRKPD